MICESLSALGREQVGLTDPVRRGANSGFLFGAIEELLRYDSRVQMGSAHYALAEQFATLRFGNDRIPSLGSPGVKFVRRGYASETR